jgi:hypothetical protein
MGYPKQFGVVEATSYLLPVLFYDIVDAPTWPMIHNTKLFGYFPHQSFRGSAVTDIDNTVLATVTNNLYGVL